MGAAAFAMQATTEAGGGYVKADAMRNQADYEKKLAELNNEVLDYESDRAIDQGKDAELRGMQAAARRHQKTRLSVGAAKAQAAVTGADSSADVDSALVTGAADEAAIKANAWREQFGFTTRANQIKGQMNSNTLQARSTANALEYGARSSIITGWTAGMGKAAEGYGKYSGGSSGATGGKTGGKP